jgi:hypothetical protein
MTDIDGALSRLSECRKNAAIASGVCGNSFETSLNDIGTPAVFSVFLEVAGGRMVAVRVPIDLRLVALDTEEI